MLQRSTQPGEDELLIAELAGCLGAWAAHAAPEELASTLASGPLAPAQPGGWPQRLGNALALASTIQHGLPRCSAALAMPQLPAAHSNAGITPPAGLGLTKGRTLSGGKG